MSAAETDLSDFFSFDVEQTGVLVGATGGYRFRVVAYLGAKEFARFGVDTVVATNMTGEPDAISNLTPVEIAGLATAKYRTYPIPDHIADKHAAMVDTYSTGEPSTRYRDLVDLVLLATTQSPDAEELHAALHSEYAHRGLAAPDEVSLPSPAWHDGYSSVASETPALGYPSAPEALAIVKKLIDPILAGRTSGTWDPDLLAWSD